MRVVLLLLAALLAPGRTTQANPGPELFDAHIHYSEDVWDKLSPQRALELMTEAGISRALVSATPGEGAERLFRAAPNRVVPFLRPYADRAMRASWFRDIATLSYVRHQLSRAPYQGIGEFHLSGEDAQAPVVQQLVELARERGLTLHAHTDLVGVQALLRQAPDIPVIWAHGGFDVPEETLRQLLGEHEQLYIELSFREGITEAGHLTAVWSALMTDFRSRFLIGTDTYVPMRWLELPELAAEIRAWLGQLPEDVARSIAYANADRLFPRPDGDSSAAVDSDRP
jgi:hypothetical protein